MGWISYEIEETAKGIRIHVHVYGNDQQETIISALITYEKTLSMFKEKGHTMAVMNGGA